MSLTWISLLPPLVVISVVCFTQQLNISLAIGIIVAALIAAHGHPIAALALCGEKLSTHFFDSDNIYLYSLLIVISSLITLLTVTGSAAGCAQIIGKKMRTKRSVEISTIMLSFLLSIDDYLSILTVGFVMKPIVDKIGVARTKLAYIVHSLGGPLVIIMPLSTWAAAILAQFDGAGIHAQAPHKIIAEPFYVYLTTIPFIFYSMFVIISVGFVVVAHIQYGAIAQDERNTVAQHDASESEQEISVRNHSLSELLIPIFLLVVGVVVGILYAGNYYAFGGNNSFVDAFRENSKTFLVLFISASVAFVVSVGISLYKKMITVRALPMVVYEGVVLMYSSIIMVALASILGNFLRIDLHTGSYIASLLSGTTPLFLIPVMLFMVSLLITLMTGSAWGTFSLLIPITTQMLISFLQLNPPVMLDQIPILFPSLGAVLSGAACGNHISPIADTTIMTATSTGTQPLKHAKSQFYYVVPVLIATITSFVLAGIFCGNGIVQGLLMPLGAGCAIMIVCFIAFNYLKKGH